MRYLIKFIKKSEIKFISHLDLMRTIQRIIRRADLPVEYSKGFNPHMDISLAQPLSVGVYSSGEYLDINFTKELAPFFIKDKLIENSPTGISFIQVDKVNEIVGKKTPSSMAIIDAASYTIKIKFLAKENYENSLKLITELDEWNIIKKSKCGEKLTNIKPMVRNMDYKTSDNNLRLEVLLSCGSKENLSPELLAQFIKKNCEGVDLDAFTEIERKELYANNNNMLITLADYFKL